VSSTSLDRKRVREIRDNAAAMANEGISAQGERQANSIIAIHMLAKMLTSSLFPLDCLEGVADGTFDASATAVPEDAEVWCPFQPWEADVELDEAPDFAEVEVLEDADADSA